MKLKAHRVVNGTTSKRLKSLGIDKVLGEGGRSDIAERLIKILSNQKPVRLPTVSEVGSTKGIPQKDAAFYGYFNVRNFEFAVWIFVAEDAGFLFTL